MDTIDKVLQGLQLLRAHGGVCHISADKDEIYAGPDDIDGVITPEDCKRLIDLGWHWDTEYSSWFIFV